MKKTFTINIGGTIFHIDEDAFEKLNSYLKLLRSHFSNTQGREEILSDIENRIAELLGEKLGDSKEVITIEDVEDIISILGEPNDFEDDTAEERTESQETLRGPKRLYRDPDNQIIGGVCSGLGAYFRIDPLWFRVIFIFSLLVWGSGVLLYLILWIAVPKAKTTSERLEMKGEKVTVDNIEKSIREELEQIRVKINDLANQAKGGYKKKVSAQGNIFEDIAQGIVSVLKVAFRVIVIIIGLGLLLAGLFMLMSFFAVYFGYEGIFIDNHHELIQMPFRTLFYLFMPHETSFGFFNIGLILFIGVPLVMLIYNATRMIFRFERVKYAGLTAFNIWLVGAIIVAIFSFRALKHFRYEEMVKNEISINQPTGDTLYLTLKEWMPENSMDADEVMILANDIELAIVEGKKYIGEVDISLKKSPDDDFHAVLSTKAWGRSVYAAKANASAVHYNLHSGDSLIEFSSYYILPDTIPWAKHEVEIQILVPEGKEVKLDKNLKNRMSRYRQRIHIRSFDENRIRSIETIHKPITNQKINFIRTIFEHKIASKTMLI